MNEFKIYNTYTRSVEVFMPLKKNKAGIYACGPTVYDYIHIGNLRTYIFVDLLVRTLDYLGYSTKHVMNITDVGHLTSDADEGEDKLEKGAKREGKSVKKIVDYYTAMFLEDINAVNVGRPKKLVFASEHIKEQIKIIKKLFEKGFAYDTPEAIYFNVSKFPNYTKLSGQKLGDKIIGAREEVVTETKKKNPNDFALWFKLTGKFKNHILHWLSPWGEGFPGWHIECSAMSTKYLGQPFDIHAGGVDLILPHHTNEIAQSEGAFDKPLANYWIHGEHLLINEGRMGKSEGNFLRLGDLIERGFSPLAFRYLVISAHYRTKLNFSWESLEAAQNALDNLYERVSELKGQPSVAGCADYEKTFMREVSNDLDMPRALSLTWRLVKSDNPDKLKLSTLKRFDKVLGLNLLEGAGLRKKIPREVKELILQRELLRTKKDFATADSLRTRIEELGYEVKDTSEGPVARQKIKNKSLE